MLEKFNQSQAELSSPLSQLKMSSVFYTHSTMKQPWGVKMPAIPSSTMFHLVLEGTAVVVISGKNIVLNPGDFILLPRGRGHDIIDKNLSPAEELTEQSLSKVTEFYERLTTGGDGDITTTLCGTVLFENEITKSIINSMPDHILIPSSEKSHSTIKSTVNSIKKETRNSDFCAGLIVSKLADILILQCIRTWISQFSDINKNWIVAYTDKNLSAVMYHIHNDTASKIDLEKLSQMAKMSRTSFINHFKNIVGQTPKKYINNWRLAIAKDRLKNTNENVLNIAFETGYQSESSFSRAYKTKYGESPSITKSKSPHMIL
ncbi:hypothetical protein TW85_16605 [Marinomonas sp. S3726]|uniref:AraC family transcriptional regulator n=1 Tax=Marinomonas sp. S3726 TaxID=579484 RepID=UPI0005F9F7DE|nr:AraC family transcriptional regulator [Marinomonas sp. S3726]KJZ11990.1 hypothetical protein TW85_16605 [Marinomonas sp. S3726]